MKPLVRLDHLKDPDALAHVTDAFGEPMGAIYLHDLTDWAFLTERLECWLAHSSPATRADYDAFLVDRFGPADGPRLDDIVWMLGAMSARMRALINGVGS